MKSAYHLQESPIPEGYQIYEERLEVAGLVYRKKDVARFIRGRRPRLEFEREPTNKHDPNAIKIIGISESPLFGPRKRHIGYVPAEIAERIVAGGYWNRVLPRLLHTYLSDKGFVEVDFQLLGPRGGKRQYEDL